MDRITKLIVLCKEYGDAIVGIGVLVSAVSFMASVNSRTNENTDRLERQRDHMIRTETEFHANFSSLQSQLTELLKSTTRIEQYQKDHESHRFGP